MVFRASSAAFASVASFLAVRSAAARVTARRIVESSIFGGTGLGRNATAPVVTASLSDSVTFSSPL